MENLSIYERVRSVPETAKRTIQAGRLKGKTDINPMWRIKELTAQFGPCGIGWKYAITDKRLESGANNEIAAFLDINLYVKVDGEWSEPIPGTGGSAFVASERSGLYTSDECYKMALTDAISVACKALGFGADVYWDKDTTKYDKPAEPQPKKPANPSKPSSPSHQICNGCGRVIATTVKKTGELWPAQDVARYSQKRYNAPYCVDCMRKLEAERDATG